MWRERVAFFSSDFGLEMFVGFSFVYVLYICFRNCKGKSLVLYNNFYFVLKTTWNSLGFILCGCFSTRSMYCSSEKYHHRHSHYDLVPFGFIFFDLR